MSATAAELLATRGWAVGETEHDADLDPGDLCERTFYVPSAKDAATLRALLGQRHDAPVTAWWEIARYFNAQRGDFDTPVQLVAQAGCEQSFYGEDTCPAAGLEQLFAALDHATCAPA
ncbi:hypothetical protein GCM10011374_35670 [Kocuria dechangensis]|uniref:Uncharacterized protein n=1 Tax=Kocuria dechangensis TaxID=1176249 RepID=A0A917LZV3_9MICC|nr:hypothetical protein [Kocuria dechangensis]GGG68203.1 hypothetical protein GCM10011374_35670 [Kocuria dechangensis]